MKEGGREGDAYATDEPYSDYVDVQLENVLTALKRRPSCAVCEEQC